MSKKMLINASHSEENRVAIVVDGILSELDIEIAGQEQTKGNIYKAVVVRVESGLQAAFVDYGAEKMGFLQIGEIHPNLYPGKENQDSKNRPRINDILQRGQELLVQIVKEERGTKGAALTTFLSLPGRYMVLMPDSKTKGVSRKISEESERKQLKKTMAALDLPERMGYIVRTAGIGKEQEELKRDFDYLVSLYQGILNRKDQVKAPAQLYQESNLVIRSIRDYFSNEMDEVLIDDTQVFREAKDFFSLVMPEQAGLVKQHRERRPIFSRFQIEEQIDGLARNQIPLPSGGSIVIDQTEALVAIDVNSGKMSSESGIEATAGKTNLEAAAEVGRQLRLRDLGGLIVIDFIDMRDRKRIREVEQALRTSLRDDKAKVTVGRISQFGLLEMSRQRIKAALSVGAYLDCPHCQGKGRIKSVEAQAVGLLRQAHAAASKGHIGRIETRTPLDVATYLLNEKRAALNDLEKQLNLRISIVGCPEFTPGQVELELHKREKQPEQDQAAAPVSHANQIEEALAAANQEKSEPEKQVEAGETAETTAENGEESTGRKRRRRRRKRSGRKETPEQQTAVQEVATPSPEDKQPEETRESAETTQAAEPISGETVTDTAEPVQAKPRSRRSPRKPAKAKSKEPASEVAFEDKVEAENRAEEKPKRRAARKAPAAKQAMEEPTAENQQATSETAQEETIKTETAPKRRAPRKTAAKKTTESATDQAEAVTPQGTAAPGDKPEAEEKPKRRAPRKPATKKTAGKQSEAPSAAEPTAEQASEEVKTETKPKRRTTRKTAAAKAADVPDPQLATTEEKPKRRAPRKPAVKKAEETADPATQEQTDAKPQRRAPRKSAQPKAAAAKAQPEATTAESPVQEEEVTIEEKPKRRAPARKQTKQENAAKDATAEATAEKPKRRTRKKPTITAEEQASETTPAEAPKRRSARKTAAVKTEATPDASETKPEEKPKRRAPRKTTAKKAEKAADPATQEQTDAKPKRRPPRKKPSTKTESTADTE